MGVSTANAGRNEGQLQSVLSRRGFLRALLGMLCIRFRPHATRFTAIADELTRLMCWRSTVFAPRLEAA